MPENICLGLYYDAWNDRLLVIDYATDYHKVQMLPGRQAGMVEFVTKVEDPPVVAAIKHLEQTARGTVNAEASR